MLFNFKTQSGGVCDNTNLSVNLLANMHCNFYAMAVNKHDCLSTRDTNPSYSYMARMLLYN